MVGKNIKKITIFLIVVFLSGILMSSCKSSEKCPAFGEVKKFQKERRR